MASAFGSDSVSGFEKDPKLEDEEKKGSDNEEMKESENEEKKEGKRKLEDQDQKKGSENEEKNKRKRKLSDYELQEHFNKQNDKYLEEMSTSEWRKEMLNEVNMDEQDERKAQAEEEKKLERRERERILRLNERTIKRYKAVVPAREWEDTVKMIRERAEKDKDEWAGKEGHIQELRKARDSGLPFTDKQLLEIYHWEKRQNELLKSEMDIMMVACSTFGPKYEGDAANIKIDDD